MRLSLMLSAILTISMTALLVLVSSSDSNVYAITTLNYTYFYVDVLDNWAYSDIKLGNGSASGISGILLIPTVFSDFFINKDEDMQKRFENVGAFSLITIDTEFYQFRNVPLEIYTQYQINKDEGKIFSKENTTIDGEKAVRIHKPVRDNSSNVDEEVNYYVVHDNIPYRLTYAADVKDFQKYLPQFEQMVKTFKFAK
jgi:hypothetical protein